MYGPKPSFPEITWKINKHFFPLKVFCNSANRSVLTAKLITFCFTTLFTQPSSKRILLLST
jgi:hypothetical protein